MVDLAPDLAPAPLADVVELVAGRQHEQELAPDRHGPAASGAEQRGGLELSVGVSHVFTMSS
jgi:hypothetical protein